MLTCGFGWSCYYLGRHILPWFGAMRMIDVMPADVREWITHLQNENVSAHVIRYCKTILSAIFTTALNDVVHLHPVQGVKSPPVAKKPRVIMTPERFDKLYLALPSGTMKLLVETDIESGLRWGELTELRPRDLDFGTGVLTVSRVVVETSPRFHPDGGWFRLHIWLPAAEAAQLPTPARVHGLRHAHASWLLAGGADLQVVKERLGHSSIVTTQRYLGTLDETDDTAIDALSKIRNRGKKPGSPGRRRSA